MHCHGYSGLGLEEDQPEILSRISRSGVERDEFERQMNERETTLA